MSKLLAAKFTKCSEFLEKTTWSRLTALKKLSNHLWRFVNETSVSKVHRISSENNLKLINYTQPDSIEKKISNLLWTNLLMRF